MWSVVASLVPICVAAIYFFGPSALLVLAASTAGRCSRAGVRARDPTRPARCATASAVITGAPARPHPARRASRSGWPSWAAPSASASASSSSAVSGRTRSTRRCSGGRSSRRRSRRASPRGPRTRRGHRGSTAWVSGLLRGDNLALPLMQADPADVDGDRGATPLGARQVPEGRCTERHRDLEPPAGIHRWLARRDVGILILLCGGYLALRGLPQLAHPRDDLRHGRLCCSGGLQH